MRVTLVFDPERRPSKALREALAGGQHELAEVALGPDTTKTLTEVLLTQPQVVFLACERPAPALTALLGEFHIAYTGAPARAALLCEDQERVLTSLRRDQIPVAETAAAVTALVVGANPNLQVLLPKLPEDLKRHREALVEVAKRAYSALGLDGYGQVELALAEGQAAVVGVRAAPWTEAIGEEAYFLPMLARGEKVSDVVDRLVGDAAERIKRF